MKQLGLLSLHGRPYSGARRLATANRSSVSTVTKIGQGLGVVKLVKIFLASSLITVQNLVAVCHTVQVNVGGHKICGCYC